MLAIKKLNLTFFVIFYYLVNIIYKDKLNNRSGNNFLNKMKIKGNEINFFNKQTLYL